MDFISTFLDLIINLDKHLGAVIQKYGLLTYIILFVIVFCETGLVVTPFLPGDSLLFTAGAFAANGALDVMVLFVLLTAASIFGDTVNYWAGNRVGPAVFRKDRVRFINKEHLERTERFYEKHGGKTIIIARFIPIIRTFAPFVAGIGKMRYVRFLEYNVLGGILWNITFIFGGYFFGNIPVVKNNFTAAIFLIIFMSFTPMFYEFIKHRKNKMKK